jgi:hypothetical protein
LTYRAQVHHVSYWRGLVKRWSTVYDFDGVLSKPIDSAAATLVLTADDNMCYGSSSSKNGGTYSCAIYNNATGGTPIASVTRFDYTNPTVWITYAGGSWATAPGFAAGTLEGALQVEWAAGLSKTGKPVYLRKWYHAIPTIGPSAGAQFATADVTKLTAAANGLVNVLGSYGLILSSKSGRLAGAAKVSAYAGAHQVVRGKRRKPLVTAAGRYTGPAIQLPVLAD